MLVEADGLLDQRLVVFQLPHGLAGHELGVAAQQYVGAAAGHVGGDGHRAHLAGLGHDLGLFFMELGVQHHVLHAPSGQHAAEQLALFDGDRAHQHRLAGGVALDDLLDDGGVLGLHRDEHGVVHVVADHGPVGGYGDDIQLVDAVELLLLGLGRAGHAGELFIHAEVVLEGDGGQGLALPLHLHALLGLDGLVQAVGVAAAHHQAAGELVHDDDLAVLDHVVHVPLHHLVGAQRAQDVVVQLLVLRVGQVAHAEEALGLAHAPLGQRQGLVLLVPQEVALHGQAALPVLLVLLGLGQAGEYELVGPVVQLGGLVALAGDDQRRAGLVDEDRVHLVHDGEVQRPLDHALLVGDHVVPQVVEAEFIVGAIGDVRGVGDLPLGGVQVVDDQAHGQPQEAVHLAHPLALELGQVVVDGDHVHALAGQGIQHRREGGRQGLALACAHLRDAALVQHDAADQLHVKGPLVQNAHARLAHQRVGLGQQRVQRLAPLGPLAQLGDALAHLVVGQLFGICLQRVDLVHRLLQLPDLRIVGCLQQIFQKIKHVCPPRIYRNAAETPATGLHNTAYYSLMFIIP